MAETIQTWYEHGDSKVDPDLLHKEIYSLLQRIAFGLQKRRFPTLDPDDVSDAVALSWQELCGQNQDYSPLRQWLDGVLEREESSSFERALLFFMSRSVQWNMLDLLRKKDAGYANMIRRVKRCQVLKGMKTAAGVVVYLASAEAGDVRYGKPWTVDEVVDHCQQLDLRLPQRGLDDYLRALFMTITERTEFASSMPRSVLVQALVRVQQVQHDRRIHAW